MLRKKVTAGDCGPILPAMNRGKFITFEGGDGVGKSTQILRLADRLRARGIPCLVTREPGGTPFAECVRNFVLDGSLPEHPAMAEAFLFAAARYDHVHARILPALAAGQWVLSDRFSDSTRAYQGAAGGVELDALMQLEGLTHDGCRPDLTLILDLDPVVGQRRVLERGATSERKAADPFEQRNLAFQNSLRAAFLDIARREPERCRVIDASREAEAIEGDIWAQIAGRFDLEAR